MAAILSDAQFGVPLETILERPYERHIPSLVKDLCFYLSKCGALCLYLYRVFDIFI